MLRGKDVKDCGIGYPVCYPSCFFWVKGGCNHPAFVKGLKEVFRKKMREISKIRR